MMPEPVTLTVTDSDWAVVMLESAGVTDTEGVVGGVGVGWLLSPPPPHAARMRARPLAKEMERNCGDFFNFLPLQKRALAYMNGPRENGAEQAQPDFPESGECYRIGCDSAEANNSG
jgi:hypothetical protein